MPYEMLTSLTSRLYLSWELFTQGILILVPGSLLAVYRLESSLLMVPVFSCYPGTTTVLHFFILSL